MLTWQLVLVFLSLGIAVAAIFMALLVNRRLTRDIIVNEQQLMNRIVVLESELSAMMDGAFGVASHLQKVEINLKDTVQRQEQLQQRDMGNLPYNDAVRLASKGASVDELVEHCSLSRSEAELVAMLHKKSIPVSADSVVSNEGDISSKLMTSPEIDQPIDEQLNTTEQAVEKIMAGQFQVDSNNVNDVAGEEFSAIQSAESIPGNADDSFSFDDVLTRSQDFQEHQDRVNKPAASEDTNDMPDAPHGSDERH